MTGVEITALVTAITSLIAAISAIVVAVFHQKQTRDYGTTFNQLLETALAPVNSAVPAMQQINSGLTQTNELMRGLLDRHSTAHEGVREGVSELRRRVERIDDRTARLDEVL